MAALSPMHVTRALPLIAAICATTSVWAEAPVPVVVWDGDFSSLSKTVTVGGDSVTYSIGNVTGSGASTSSANSVGSDKSYLQIAAGASNSVDNNVAAPTVTAAGGASPFGSVEEGSTVLVFVSGLPSTAGSNRALLMLMDGDHTYGGGGSGHARYGIARARGSSGSSSYGGALYGGFIKDGAINTSVYNPAKVFTENKMSVALTYKATSGLSYYVDGELKGSYNPSATDFNTISGVCIGGVDYTSSSWFYRQNSMKIHTVAIFNRALSASEIAEYESQSKWRYCDAIAWRNTTGDFHQSTYAPVSSVSATASASNTRSYATSGEFLWSTYLQTGATCPIAIFYDTSGQQQSVGGDFSNLYIGGLNVTATPSSGTIYTLTGKNTNGQRETMLGDQTGNHESWFVFNESYTISRAGSANTTASLLYGTVNMQIADGKMFSFNSGANTAASNLVMTAGTSNTAAPQLKMIGAGQFTLPHLNASTGKLDYSALDPSSQATTPFINGLLTVSDNTTYAFPALSGAATFKAANKLSADATRTTTFTIGENEYTAPLTFTASTGEIAFPAVATLAEGAMEVANVLQWDNIVWDAKPATISSTTPVVINVTDDTLLMLSSPLSVKSLVFNISAGKTLRIYAVGAVTVVDGFTVTGGGTLEIYGAQLYVTGNMTFSENVTLAFHDMTTDRLTVNGTLTVPSGKTLTLAPATIEGTSATLVSATSISGTVALSAPADAANTYDIETTSTAVTLKRSPVPGLTYKAVPGASPSGWFSSWEYDEFTTALRVGPSASHHLVWEVLNSVADANGPGSAVASHLDGTSDFTLSLYADVSKMVQNDTTRCIMLGVTGSTSNGKGGFLIYEKNGTVYATGFKNGNFYPTADTVGISAGAGYHLWTMTYDVSEGTLTLYKDDGGTGKVASGTVDSAGRGLLGDVTARGLQIGTWWTGLPSAGNWAKGNKMAVAQANGYAAALLAEEVANIATFQYPATDGTTFNHSVINTTADTTLTVYSSTTTEATAYFGVSAGTTTIPSGETVNVVNMRNGTDNGTGSVGTTSGTLTIDGTLNVSAVSTVWEVAGSGGNSGIVNGWWSSGTQTITVNDGGELIANNANVEMPYSAYATSSILNVSGGTVKVNGLYNNRSNGSGVVNLAGNGVLQVNEITDGGYAITKNFGYGTFRVTADATETRAINFSGTAAAPTTLDPYGHTLTLETASLTGSGYITVVDSSEYGNGTVVFPAVGTFTGYVILTDANAANIDLSAYTGKVLLRGTAAATLTKLDNFAGTVKIDQAGTYDARSVDLSFATVEVSNAGATLQATAGQEGAVTVVFGALQLYLSNAQFLTDGYVFRGIVNTTGGATLTYFHGEARATGTVTYDAGDELSATELAVVQAGTSIAPYYRIFVGDSTGEAGTLSTLAHWANSPESLPVSGNMAIKVESNKTLTVDIDNTTTFGEVLVFGSGTVVFTGSGTMTVSRGIYATSGTSFSIESGIAENVNIYALDTGTVAQIDCGTEADPFDVTFAGTAGIVMVAAGKYANFAGASVDDLVVNGTANVGETSSFRVSGSLSVGAAGTLNFASTTFDCSYAIVTVASGGTVNATGASSLTFATLNNDGTVALDSTSSLAITTATGTGRVEYAGKRPDGNAWATGTSSSGWRGTVAVKDWDNSSSDCWTPANYGNANSTLEVDDCNVYYFADSTTTALPTLKLAGDLTVNNGSSTAVNSFAGLSGTGTLTVGTGSVSQTMKFADASTFGGSIVNNSFKVVIGSSDGANGTITIDAGKTVNLASGKKLQSTNIALNGTVALAASGTLQGAVTAAGSAKVVLASSPLTVTGTLTATALEIDPGSIALNKSTATALITGLTSEPAEATISAITVDGATVSKAEDSGTWNICAKLRETEWSMGDGTWTTTSFNGSSDYVSGLNVMFADSSSATATVTISGSPAPGTVSFNSTATAYTLTGGTFAPGGTVTLAENTSVTIGSAATGKYYVNSGATLTLTDATVTSVSGDGTLHIPAGGVVTLTANTSLNNLAKITGSGMLIMPNGAIPADGWKTILTAGPSVANDDSTGWMGTVAIYNKTSWTQINPNLYGNASSKVLLCGVTGYFVNPADTRTITPEVVFENFVGDYSTTFAFDTTDGYSYSSYYAGNTNVFLKISGSGTLLQSGLNSKTPSQGYVIRDGSGFTGSINRTMSSGGTIYMFAATGGPNGWSSDYSAGMIYVFPNTSATLGDGSQWSPGSAIKIAGTVEMLGMATMTGAVTLSDGATLKFDDIGTSESPKKLTLSSTLTFASGTVNIAFGDGVAAAPYDGATLISWSAAPDGVFAFADDALDDDWVLYRDTDGLKVYSAHIMDGAATPAEVGTISMESDGLLKATISPTSAAVTLPNYVTKLDVAVTPNAFGAITASGVADGNVSVKYGETITTGAYLITKTGDVFSFDLNTSGTVGGVSVTPALGDDSPIGVEAATMKPTFAVKAIPGLWYALESCDTATGAFTAGTAVQATGSSITLTAAEAPATVKYYKIKVGATSAM